LIIDRGVSGEELEDRGEEIDKRITWRLITWGNNLIFKLQNTSM
jgi:hypothetical protein